MMEMLFIELVSAATGGGHECSFEAVTFQLHARYNKQLALVTAPEMVLMMWLW
jgi:hypothetical protein